MAEGREHQAPVITAASQYHAGIVSDDPAATMAQLSELLGYEWGEPMGGPATVSLPDGDEVIELRLWYSTTTPRLEVVQSRPGTVWSRADSGIHHFGYWVDDVAATMEALQRQGYRFEAAGKGPGGAPYWAYLIGPAGPRLEIVSRQLQPMMERYFETGRIG